MINSQEEERKRIAAELHDSLGQHLLLIKSSVELVRRKLDSNHQAAARLGEVRDLAGEAVHEVRAITNNLRPAELDRLGLRAATEAMLDRVAEHSHAEIPYDLSGLEGDWSETHRTALYRLVQEGTNNALKHSAANMIEIKAHRQGHDLEVAITDNGHGFDKSTIDDDTTRGMGLSSMRERACVRCPTCFH